MNTEKFQNIIGEAKSGEVATIRFFGRVSEPKTNAKQRTSAMEIAADPANVQAAAESTKTAEEKIAEKVTQVVGENFQFKSMK